MNFGRRGGFASPRSIASARLADLVGPNAVAGHERLDGVGLDHDPEKACPALDARGGYRFSLATNAKRLRGGHAQTKR